jgi:sulfur carrier protein ThiS
MRLHLGGHLAWYDPQRRSWLDVPLAQPAALADIVAGLGLPAAEIAIVSVNGQAVDLAGAQVADGDRVELYPPLGGGSC